MTVSGAVEMRTVDTRTEATEPVDALLGQEDAFHADLARFCTSRAELIWQAVRWHRETNQYYDRYCARHALPDEPDPQLPLTAVPLLPTVLFKREPRLVNSADGAAQVIETKSSGTRGTVSTVPRCNITLMRFLASVAVGSREVLGWETVDQSIFHLGPTVRDDPNLWIAYVMAGIGVFMSSRSYLHGDRLLAEPLIEDIARADLDRGVMIVGPPPLILDLARLAATVPRLRLGPASQIVTIGGWKRRDGERVGRATFRRIVAENFGLGSEEQIRDTYNMVELNTVLFECTAHALHAPPWLGSCARDPRTLEPLPSGSEGLLSFLDPTAVSYPCFLLTDDFGAVHFDVDCRCGIRSDTVEVHRRVSRVESRGCALKLDLEPTMTGGQR